MIAEARTLKSVEVHNLKPQYPGIASEAKIDAENAVSSLSFDLLLFADNV